MKNKPILVIGLGNPIRGDDGVGWHVANLVQERLANDPAVEFDFMAVGGLSLMERMVGYDQVILIDAMTDQEYPIGSLIVTDLNELPNQAQGRLCSAHDVSFQNALEVGRLAGVQIPSQINIVGVEAESVYDFSDQLSPAIQQVVPEAAQCVLNLILKGDIDDRKR